MSFDSDSAAPPPSSSRDWYFPSPPFVHSSKFPNYPRRFPTNPTVSQHYPPDSRSSFRRFSSPVPTPPLRDVSSSSSAPHRTVNHAGIRRRAGYARRGEQLPRTSGEDVVPARKSEISGALLAEKVSAPKKLMGFSDHCLEFRVRWKMAITVAVSLSLYILTHQYVIVEQVFEAESCFVWLQILITAFSSLVYQNISLHNEVNELQVNSVSHTFSL